MKWHQRFFWLLLLLLPTQLGVHFWPEWAGVLGRRVDYLSPTIYSTDILIFLTLSSWLIESGKEFLISNFKFLINRRNVKFFVFLFIFVIVNIVGARSQPVVIYKWLKVLEFVGLGWYIMRTKSKLSAISLPLSIGVLYSSILAIVQFFLQHSIGGLLWWLGERTFDAATPGIARTAWYGRELLRPYATFSHPNVLGGFLAAVLPLLIFRYLGDLGSLRKRTKTLLGSTILFGVAGLLLTFSRSAIVVGAVAIAVMIAHFRFQISSRRQSGYSASATNFKLLPIFFLVTIFGFLLITRHPSLITPNEESIVVRQQLNIAAIKLWVTSPLLGVGLGNFLVRLPEALPTRTIYFLQPVHNIYLLVLAETGVVGLMMFILLIWRSIKGLGVSSKEKNKNFFSNQTTLYVIPYTCFLLLGFVDHYPLTLQQGQVLFTVLAGMSLASIH